MVPYSPPQDRSPSIPIRQPRVVALTVAPPFLRRPGRPPLPYLPYVDEKKVAGRGKEAEERDRSEGKGGGREERKKERKGRGEKEATVCSFSSPQLPFLYWGGFYGMEN